MRSIVGWAAVLASLSGVACGGGGGGGGTTGPGSLPTPPTGFAAGTALQVVSGEDGAPVAGATVTVAGRAYTTDSAGQAPLADAAPFGTLVDLVGDGFLDRQTVLRSGTGTRFVLWPRTSASGLDEVFTQQIVYTFGAFEPPELGATPLRRLPAGTTQVVVHLSEDILADDGAVQRHQQAADEINVWLAGRARYSLSSTPPATGVVFRARVDEQDATCVEDNVRALFRGTRNGRGEITGGEIVYCDPRIARHPTVTHELGHSVGLSHSLGDRELMTPYFSRYRSEVFSEREGLVMGLLFERPAGNRFPDNDRDAAAATGGPFEISCP